MEFEEVLNKLDFHTKAWASTLTSDDLASILAASYRIPGLINALKVSNSYSNPIQSSNAFLGAAEIGKKGEAEFERICQKLPSSYNVINTAKLGKQGDFIIEYRIDGTMYRCLVDIKNYKSTVPKKEIEKFYEDMIYGNYEAGIMISYAAKFTGITDSVYIENKELPYNRVPIMYLSEIPFDLIIKCIEILFLKIHVTQERQSAYTQLESSIMFINIALQQSASTRRVLSELSNTVSSQIQRCQENLISLELQIKQSIKNINSKLETVEKVKIPILQRRPDNVEDIPIEYKKEENSDFYDAKDNTNISKDIDASTNTLINTPTNTSTNTSTNTIDINYGIFNPKDIKMVQQLVNLLVWDQTKTIYDNDRTIHLENNEIELFITALKTKTNIKITIKNIPSGEDVGTLHLHNEELYNNYKKVLYLCKRRGNDLITNLSQRLVDELSCVKTP